MITIEVTGDLPQIELNLPEAFDLIGKHMVRSVQINFERGGRPEWKPTRSGETPLVGTGRLYRSINYAVDAGGVTISAGRGLPYAGIQQFGGHTHPTVTEKSKKFFWAMFFATGEEKWKWLALKKAGTKLDVFIQSRPYMMFQPQDIDMIKSIIKAKAIKITYASGESSTIQ